MTPDTSTNTLAFEAADMTEGLKFLKRSLADARCQIPILCRAGYRSGWRELCDKASKSALPMERRLALPRWPSELAPTARPTPQSGYG